jgi:hypothetical protein
MKETTFTRDEAKVIDAVLLHMLRQRWGAISVPTDTNDGAFTLFKREDLELIRLRIARPQA